MTLSILAVLIRLACALVIAFGARNSGRNFWLWFVIGGLFGPIVGIVALGLKIWIDDKRETKA